MRLDRVTITGADDSVKPEDLIALSKEFPFVEWGILLSESRINSPRFPSYRWLLALYEATGVIDDTLNLSCHICGKWSRDLLEGRWSLPWRVAWLPMMFQRAQINFIAAPNTKGDKLAEVLRWWNNEMGEPTQLSETHYRQFVIQHHGDNQHVFDEVQAGADYFELFPLYDNSGGTGVTPQSWPKCEYFDVTPGPHGSGVEMPRYHGYAGGLGPNNIKEQFPLIAAAAGDSRIWIDMESRVRSDDDSNFDLAKVRLCLEICAPVVAAGASRK